MTFEEILGQAIAMLQRRGRVTEVFELVGASALRRRLQAAVVRGLTRFVGRETEMTALAQALAQAGAGHGQVMAAVGEAGNEPRTVRAKVTGHLLTLGEALQDIIPALLALLEALPADSPFLRLDPPQRRQEAWGGLLVAGAQIATPSRASSPVSPVRQSVARLLE